MKALILAVTLFSSVAAMANPFYDCDVAIDGYITKNLNDLDVVYGQSVSIAVAEHHILHLSIKSTGRSNRMPRNRLAFAVEGHKQIMNSNALEFDGLPSFLNLSKEGGDLFVDVNCELKD